MGGVIAFEVARTLEQAGEQVSLLALLDAPFALPDAGAADVEPRSPAGSSPTRCTAWAGMAGAVPDPATASADEQLGWLAGRLGDEQPGGQTGDGQPGDEQAGDGQPGEGQPGEGRPGGEQLDDVQSGGAVDGRLRNRFEVFRAHAAMLAGYRAEGPPSRHPR